MRSKRTYFARLWRAIVKRHRRGQRSGRAAAGGGRVGATGSKKKRIDADSFGVSALSFFFAGFGAAFWRGGEARDGGQYQSIMMTNFLKRRIFRPFSGRK